MSSSITARRIERRAEGVVEVVEDPEHPWGLGTCGVVVMEQCVEP